MSETHESTQAALSDQHKEAVKSWVSKARKVLEQDLRAQLTRLGISAEGKVTPLEAMTLAPDAQTTRRRVEALLKRDVIAEGDPKRGYDNVLRELTYTTLNRLVGLKAMEARRVLYLPPPAGGPAEQTEVITPVPGQAHSRYLRDFRAAGGSRYKYEDDAEEALLRDGLQSVYRHINEEIRLLFDLDHEYACVRPTHACMVQVIEMINKDLAEEAFRAADFLGWIYQFFNREEKKRVRDENKGTPRSSYELSVINQFYTPSWVVKALVDNTLGRLWLQMHPDSVLRPIAKPPLPNERDGSPLVVDYLVPRTGERIRYQRLSDTGEVERFKRVRDITLLDPACGTMHFGQYAFNLFLSMYLEEIHHAGEDGWPETPSVASASEIPAAILEHNLFGIDIDPRAIQIASLSLMLTAKEAAIGLGMLPVDVRVKRANLVVANTVDIDKERLRQLVRRLRRKLVSEDIEERLVTTLWESLQSVPELGSLIQVREGVAAILEDWALQRAKLRGATATIRTKAQPLFDAMGMTEEVDRGALLEKLAEQQNTRKAARELERELLSAVEEVASAGGSDPADRLFAEDTARGLKLLQVLSRSFDVVVMNPPYGAFVPSVRDYVNAAYPLTKNDIYLAFIDRATQLIEPEGYIGALISRTFVAQVRAQKFREQILLKRNPLLVLLDLGQGILDDATVEAAAVVLKGSAR